MKVYVLQEFVVLSLRGVKNTVGRQIGLFSGTDVQETTSKTSNMVTARNWDRPKPSDGHEQCSKKVYVRLIS